MKVNILASGSKGNATIITTTNHNILIDAGITYHNAITRSQNIPNIDTIIITHTHEDHIKGLQSFIKKYNPKIYTISDDLKNHITYEKIYYLDDITIDDITIKLFELSHDTKCSGIIIKDNDKELVYMTDTGYISNKNLSQIKDKNMYIIESNHDIELLRNSKYPFYLKQRILGDKGHLSNEATSNYLKKLVGENTKTVVLAHLSEENNTPALALEQAKKAINKNIKLYVAKQEESLETIEV